MRFSSKPVSSPGRTKNPPLLMRFLRTTAGSKSRRRSRSRTRSRKPIFFRKTRFLAMSEERQVGQGVSLSLAAVSFTVSPRWSQRRYASKKKPPKKRSVTNSM
uniref:Uncharacterized protein n=1 Tax=Brassica oleracea TaxID=3712 RepID=A0A3P6CNK9_BRAOL|nr:unnamed protein product [Brassica oleracea]